MDRDRETFVIAKCGMSLDGRLTRPPNEGRWLTSPSSRRHARQLRAEVDAIIIGAETLRQDNPRLTAAEHETAGNRGESSFLVLENSRGRAQVFTDRFSERTLVFRKETLSYVLGELGRRQITSVLIEGGGEVLGQAFDARLVDRVQFYVAPLLTGGPVVAVAGKGALHTARRAPGRGPLRETGPRFARHRVSALGWSKILNNFRTPASELP